jgi:UDP-N-acetylmuramoyl-tripeptide--D-alanyl-D-alanine ligase
MDRIRLTEAARAVRGRFLSLRRAGIAHGISTDSRTTKDGDLFVALRGPRHDGHDHVARALARGAVGAIVERDFPLAGHFPDRILIQVEDTRRALLELAAWYRRRFNPTVIAITGSNGKTTTKELVAAALGTEGVVKSPASFNNEIGVPLTLFRIESTTRYVVVEIGTNAPGEVAELARAAAPTHGIVTSIGPAHLEGFGSLDGVAREKGALYEAIPDDGVAFVNQEDLLCREQAVARGPDLLVTYGTDPEADVFALEPWRSDEGRIGFLLYGRMPISVPVSGLHNLPHVLAALSVVLYLGIDLETVVKRLADVVLPAGRLQRSEVGGVALIRDTYNANPASMRAALQELKETFADGRHVAILGDMLELGEEEEGWHRDIGQCAAELSLDALWTVGERGRWIADGARDGGLDESRVFRSGGVEEARRVLPFRVAPGDVVLLKASRGVRLEELADELEARIRADAEMQAG